MVWSTSDRRSRLPADWPKVRAQVLKRDNGRCTWMESNVPCGLPATDVDHIRRGDNHSMNNLRALCSMHHARKSGSEGAAAMAAKRKQIRGRFRRTEPSPLEHLLG